MTRLILLGLLAAILVGTARGATPYTPSEARALAATKRNAAIVSSMVGSHPDHRLDDVMP